MDKGCWVVTWCLFETLNFLFLGVEGQKKGRQHEVSWMMMRGLQNQTFANSSLSTAPNTPSLTFPISLLYRLVAYYRSVHRIVCLCCVSLCDSSESFLCLFVPPYTSVTTIAWKRLPQHLHRLHSRSRRFPSSTSVSVR